MVNVKFIAIAEVNGEPQVASGIVTNCPSLEALKTKLEDEMGLTVIEVVEATEQEVADAHEAQ